MTTINVHDLVIKTYDAGSATSTSDWLAQAEDSYAVPVGVIVDKYNEIDASKNHLQTMLSDIVDSEPHQDTFLEIIEAAKNADESLAERIQNFDITMTTAINDAQTDRENELGALEVDVKAEIDLRNGEISTQLSNSNTDISGAIDSFINDANAKVSDLNAAFFGGEGVIHTQLVKNLGFSEFDCNGTTYAPSANVTGGKIFQVFDLTNHCVSLEAEDGNLLFKAVTKANGSQVNVLKLKQSSVVPV